MNCRLLPLLAGLALCGAIGMAHADQFPRRGHYDSRMRAVAYNPGQVVHLSTRVGATLVVGFSEKEKVSAVAETDTLHLASIPKGNYLFFKPSAALALQPVVVLTTLPDGRMRRYVFEIKTVTTRTMANGADGIYYSVQFVYPHEMAAAQVAEQAAAEKIQMVQPAHGVAAQQGLGEAAAAFQDCFDCLITWQLTSILPSQIPGQERLSGGLALFRWTATEIGTTARLVLG